MAVSQIPVLVLLLFFFFFKRDSKCWIPAVRISGHWTFSGSANVTVKLRSSSREMSHGPSDVTFSSYLDYFMRRSSKIPSGMSGSVSHV